MGTDDKSRVAYIWSQELQDVSDELPSNSGRSSMVHGLIKALDLLDDDADDNRRANGDDNFNKATVFAPDEDLGSEQCLLKYHDQSYIDALMQYRATSPPAYDPTAPRDTPSASSQPPPAKRARTKGPNLQEYRDMDVYNLSHDNPPFPKLPRYITLVAAATSTACRLLVQDEADFVICWDGGRHHAKKSEAGGFCYVNDLVLGLLLLSREGKVPIPSDQRNKNGRTKTRSPRILYLDLDLHYSDGVSSAFHSTKEYPDPMPTKNPLKPPSVMTFSIHHSATGFYPPATPWAELTNPWLPTPFSLSVPLGAYPSSKTYKTVWDGCVEPIVKEWDPDYIVLQLGSDGLPGDRVGQFGNWSVEEEGGMRWCIEKVKKWGKKTCVTGGGGYNHPNTARAWAVVTASLLDRTINGETPIPHHEHFEEYAHSFTMEVPQGHMEDQNKRRYLDQACEDFGYISTRIKDIVASSLR